MKITLILICLIPFQVSFSQGQTVVGGNAAKAMDMNTMPFGYVSAFGSAEKTTVGSKYLYNDWKIAIIQLEPGTISNCPVKFDLKNMVIEINTDNGVRTLPMARIKRLVVGNENLLDQQIFENAKAYNGAQAHIAGLVEVLVNKQTTLLKYHYSFIKEGSYNVALDMGNNETKYLVKSKYLLFKEGKIVEIPTSKKRFIKNFPEASQKKIAQFFNESNITLKKQNDLILFCNFLNDKGIPL